ncbi:DUF6316 family protein [Agaribacterium haliotis]|uniref:DUF6316 family protein n=1 Tax=Agaribacterium haliotis TaxID=2013869 RepID=UPI000BB56B1C|nr:DUF6316 family protein [Agaribacterium haliotis]
MNRIGEQHDISPKRSSRFFQEEGYWYYNTREGVAIGPFDTLCEAETGVSDFIDFVLHAGPSVSQTLSNYAPSAA